MFLSLDSQLQDQLLKTRDLGLSLSIDGATAASGVVTNISNPSLLVLATEGNGALLTAVDAAASAVTSFISNTAGRFAAVVKLAGKDSINAALDCQVNVPGAPTAAHPCDVQLTASGNLLLRINTGVDVSATGNTKLGLAVRYELLK